MATCTIDAEYKGEERYSKLSLAFSTDEEEVRINSALKTATDKSELKPELYHSNVSNGRKVIVIEYHDDYDREAGKIFEEILATLQVKCI